MALVSRDHNQWDQPHTGLFLCVIQIICGRWHKNIYQHTGAIETISTVS